MQTLRRLWLLFPGSRPRERPRLTPVSRRLCGPVHRDDRMHWYV